MLFFFTFRPGEGRKYEKYIYICKPLPLVAVGYFILSCIKMSLSTIKFYLKLVKAAGWAMTYPNRSLAEKIHIYRDFVGLRIAKGINTDEYQNFEFDRKPQAFRQQFLGLNEQRYYLDLLNPKKYYILPRNKYFTHKMLEGTGVRKATLFCYYQPHGRFSPNNHETAGDLPNVLRILNEKGVRECVIKSPEATHGDSVWLTKDIAYSGNDAELTLFDGRKIPLSSVMQKGALIFESVVRQTKQMRDFNPSSVNTIRFMTVLYPDGSARIIDTWFKIGRVGRCVDNAGSGGNVDGGVDMATGELYHAVQYDGWENIKPIDRHPDSGQPINGTVIENWEQIKAEVIKFQQAFPYCKAAGWDIALTDDGPLVIEVNDFWDRIGQLFLQRGWRDGIRDCFLAWQRTKVKYDMERRDNELSEKMLRKIAAK